MLYRIVTTGVNHPKNKTMVIVELLEQFGAIVKIVEKVQFEVEGALAVGSEKLLHEVGKVLLESGFPVAVPPYEEAPVNSDLPESPV